MVLSNCALARQREDKINDLKLNRNVEKHIDSVNSQKVLSWHQVVQRVTVGNPMRPRRKTLYLRAVSALHYSTFFVRERLKNSTSCRWMKHESSLLVKTVKRRVFWKKEAKCGPSPQKKRGKHRIDFTVCLTREIAMPGDFFSSHDSAMSGDLFSASDCWT